MKVCRWAGKVLLVVLALLGPRMVVADGQPWAVTLYGAALSSDAIEDVAVLNAHIDGDHRLVVLALSRRIEESFDALDLEWEVQLGKHTRGQDHWEVNGLLAARWTSLPWDAWLDSSIAAGAGLSLASEVPEFERAEHDEANDFLGYLLVELEMRPPGSDRLSVVARLHHRSGAFGSFDGVYGASNAVGLGLKYRF